MKSVFYILLCLILEFAAIGQAKMLRPSDFKNQKLDDQWVYVKYKAESEEQKLPAQAKRLTASQEGARLFNVLKVKVPAGMDPVSYCNLLRRTSADLIYADPIVQYLPLATPSDALLSNQYYLDNIKAYDAWNITKGDDDITIGIIDTGIDLDHEDIITNLWINTDDPVDGIDNDENGYVDDLYGFDFADIDTDPSIQNGNHGMIVSGIAGASTNNGKGIAGVGYNTKVAALKGFKSSNNESGGLYESIIYAADKGFDVVNLSWGRMGLPLQSEQDIISYAVLDKNMVVVAAAGNEGGKATQEEKWYPASYDHVLSVGGSDQNDNKSSGSTFNYSVDLVAPGVSMFSTINGNGYTNGGPGTSYACPQVAAAAALVKDQFPSLTAVQIMERIRTTADDIYDVGSNANYLGKLGKGRLNLLRAVSEANVKSLRAEEPTITSRFGENVFFGDTVNVKASLTNHLSSISSPQITISSPDDDFTISNGTFEPGFMNTLDTREIEFEVILNEDVAPETTIGIRLDYSASGYTDFQYLDVTTSPDYADFGNEVLSMSISGDGDLGFNEYGPNFEGSGFRYELDTLMTYTGLMLATNASVVSDNIISNYTDQSRNKDFTVQKFYKLYHHQGADHFGYSEFTDDNRPVIIEQSNIAWDDEDFLIIRYRIVNNSASAINNLSLGIFSDWDLDDKTANRAAYDLTDHYIYVENNASNLFAAVQIIGGDNFEFSALDMATFNGNSFDINDLFTDTDKYDFLINQDLPTAGNAGAGNDVATINGVTITQLDPYSAEYVNVIYAISDSQVNLEAELTNAIGRLDQFLLKPRVLETFYICEGASISLNPSAGTNYQFFEDPLGETLITTASSYNPGAITNDTTFFVRNVDNNYPSDIFEIRLNLLNDIASFEMSTDTLYLDNPTTNVVQFLDKSLNAIAWSWDFGEGTFSSIQNPSLSFSTIGTYSIVLYVENEFGCTDTITKNLVVANRPSSPAISNIITCPGEEVILNDPSADKIHLYPYQNSSSPSQSGTNLSFSTYSDTTIYVSGVYGSFESEKTPVLIDVMEVNGTLAILPDTTTDNYQILFSASDLATDASIEWFLDGEAAGTTESISVPAIAGTIYAMLKITNSDGCIKTLEKNVQISTSPFASQEDLVACANEPVVLRPTNGTYFGFYEDSELNNLIKKGTQLHTNAYDRIYVAGLDDGLPGMPIEVNISHELIELGISYQASPIGKQYKVILNAVTENVISSYRWYINGILSEVVPDPVFFLTNQAYEITLEVTSQSGCVMTETLNLDFTPLGVNESTEFIIYPNPSGGMLNLKSADRIDELKMYSIDGKELLHVLSPAASIDLTDLPKGLILVQIRMKGVLYEKHLLLY